MAHLPKGLGFNLAHPFAGDLEAHAYLFQSLRLAVKQAKSLNENGAFSVCKGGKHFIDLIFEDGVSGCFSRRFDSSIFQKVAELTFAPFSNFCLERDGMLCNLVDFAHALGSEAKLQGQLFRSRLPSRLPQQFLGLAPERVRE